jgi:hypothetical protein
MTEPNQERWHLTINYRTETGTCAVDYEIEELGEIEDIVERGPDWNAIIILEVRLARAGERVVLQSPVQKGPPNASK